MPVYATVKLRRNFGFEIKDSAKKLDGNTYLFTPCGEADQNRYPGEMAWAATYNGDELRSGAPTWIAEGDLVFVMDT